MTCLVFIFRLWRHRGAVGLQHLELIRYIREELLICIGTSSSESVLPRMMAKLEALGCEKTSSGW